MTSVINKVMANGANILIASLTIILCLIGSEVIFRVIDGYQLTSGPLVVISSADTKQFVQSVDARARQYAAEIKIDPSFQLEWYDSNPPELTDRKPTFPLPADWAKAVEKETGLAQVDLRYWYNYNFMKMVCGGKVHYERLSRFKTSPGFVYTFVGPDDTPYPQFRYVPRGWDWGATNRNNFGFRGPDISFPKPAQTVRIAFLGYSTTENGYPWAYPDFVAQILREWARSNGLNVDFDVLNAGRAGVDSSGMAHIMRYEVAPLQPDIVVVSPGAANLIFREDVLHRDSTAARVQSSWHYDNTHYSALAVRLNELMTRIQTAGSEPAKPPHRLTFDLLQDVDVERVDLPFQLHQEITAMRDIAQVSRAIGAEVFLTSSVVLAHDGLRLDMGRHRLIFELLNGFYWPLTYAEIRHGVEFENRAYRALSEKDHLGFIEIDKYFPQDPDFFTDTVHFTYQSGFRLQASIMAQQLAPFIRDKLRKHELPRQAVADQDKISWARQTPKKFDLSCLP